MALINQEELNAIARLSGLSCTEEEKIAFASQLNTILEYASSLQKIAASIENQESHTHKHLLRDDIATTYQNDAIRALSPQPQDRYFAVPPIIE